MVKSNEINYACSPYTNEKLLILLFPDVRVAKWFGSRTKDRKIWVRVFAIFDFSLRMSFEFNVIPGAGITWCSSTSRCSVETTKTRDICLYFHEQNRTVLLSSISFVFRY